MFVLHPLHGCAEFEQISTKDGIGDFYGYVPFNVPNSMGSKMGRANVNVQ
jgi:hypothetical protein